MTNHNSIIKGSLTCATEGQTHEDLLAPLFKRQEEILEELSEHAISATFNGEPYFLALPSMNYLQIDKNDLIEIYDEFTNLTESYTHEQSDVIELSFKPDENYIFASEYALVKHVFPKSKLPIAAEYLELTAKVNEIYEWDEEVEEDI